jgi:hypothetical protein
MDFNSLFSIADFDASMVLPFAGNTIRIQRIYLPNLSISENSAMDCPLVDNLVLSQKLSIIGSMLLDYKEYVERTQI